MNCKYNYILCFTWSNEIAYIFIFKFLFYENIYYYIYKWPIKMIMNSKSLKLRVTKLNIKVNQLKLCV